MSNYSKFLDDLNEFYKDRIAKGVVDKISNDDALAFIRDKWIQEGKLTELISFIHTNWDSGNCDDFIEPLTALLIDKKQVHLFKTLWSKVLKYRLIALWKSMDDLKSQTENINLLSITAIDTSDFNMYSKDSYKDLRRVLAFRRRFAIDGLTKFRNGLLTLNQKDDVSKLSNYIDNVSRLKRSTFKI